MDNLKRHKNLSGGKGNFSAATDTGKVRSRNEDYYGCLPEHHIFMVADGMGGHNAGHIASKETIGFLLRCIERGPSPGIVDSTLIIEDDDGLAPQDSNLDGKTEHSHGPPEINAEGLTRLIHAAHHYILQLAKSSPQLQGMGCTLALAWLEEGTLHALHVGDSRVYHIREKNIRQLGTDHSAVAQAVETGQRPSAGHGHKSRKNRCPCFDFRAKRKWQGSNCRSHPPMFRQKRNGHDHHQLCHHP